MENHVAQQHISEEDFQRLPRDIFRAAIGNGIVAIIAMLAMAWWASHNMNTLAAENAASLLDSAIAAELDSVAISTQDYAQWDYALELLAARDDDRFYVNLGTGATESPTFDFIYVMSPAGDPIYAYETDGEGSDISIIDQQLADHLREYVFSQPLQPYQTMAEFAAIDGRFALVAAGRVQANDVGGLTKTDLPLFIGGKWLHQAMLAKIGNMAMASNVDLQTSAAEIGRATGRLPMRDASGRLLGYVTWDNPRPGNAILISAVPILMLLSCLTLFVAATVGRTSARQTLAFVQEKLRARTDPLTGLLNRAGLDEILDQPRVSTALQNGSAAIIYLDLNGFKALNDTLGHDAGDLALKAVAERIRVAVRGTDYVARLGGDEFICLVLDPHPFRATEKIARRIIISASSPINVGDEEQLIRPSIGIALAESDLSWFDLMARADNAMYCAKMNGLSQPVFYSAGMNVSRDKKIA